MRPRPGRTSSGWRRADQEEERRGGEGRGNAGEEREGQLGRVQRDWERNTKKTTKKQTPRDNGTSHPYRRDREPARARGGGKMTRRATQQIGKGRAVMRLGTSRPWKTYVSGRSTDTGSMVTQAHIWMAGLRKTRCGMGGGVTSHSCHCDSTKRRAVTCGGAMSRTL